MENVVGIFNSLADAKRAAAMLRTLGIPEERITVLSPHTSEAEIEARVPTTDAEQPGMGTAVGGTVGAAIGAAGGATAGAVMASLLVPGVGPVLAIGLLGAEQEHYTNQGGDFNLDEATYRLGFEAALHPDRRGKSVGDVGESLQRKYGADCATQAFRQGYERGRRYHVLIIDTYKLAPREEKSS